MPPRMPLRAAPARGAANSRSRRPHRLRPASCRGPSAKSTAQRPLWRARRSWAHRARGEQHAGCDRRIRGDLPAMTAPIDEIEVGIRETSERRFLANIGCVAARQRSPREAAPKCREQFRGALLTRQPGFDLIDFRDAHRHRHLLRQTALRRLASTVIGSVVPAAMAGNSSSHPLPSVIFPPQRSVFSIETMGSSRSFFGTYADSWPSALLRIMTFTGRLLDFSGIEGGASRGAYRKIRRDVRNGPDELIDLGRAVAAP